MGYAMPSGFCERSQMENVVCSVVCQQKDSQSVLQLLVEQRVNRKASSSSRHFPSTFWERSHGLWVPCHRPVPTVAQVKKELGELSLFQTGDTWDVLILWGSFPTCNFTALLGVCKACLTSCIRMEMNLENPEWFSCFLCKGYDLYRAVFAHTCGPISTRKKLCR